MSLSTADLMALDKGEDLLDEISGNTANRQHLLACINANYPLDQQDQNGRNAIIWAAIKGFEPELDAIIKRGSWVEHADNEKKTPLFHAAVNGHLGAVRRLVEEQVNLNTPDYTGKTPAAAALANGFNEVAVYLIAQGATPPPVDLDTELKNSTTVFSRPLRMVKKPGA